MATATSPVEIELRDVTGIKSVKNEDRQTYLRRLVEGVNQLSDKDFDKLSPEAREWANDVTPAFDAGRDIADPPEDETETITEESAEGDGEQHEIAEGIVSEALEMNGSRPPARRPAPKAAAPKRPVPKAAAPKAAAPKAAAPKAAAPKTAAPKAAAPKAAAPKVAAPKAAAPNAAKPAAPGKPEQNSQTQIKELLLRDPNMNTHDIWSKLQGKTSRLSVAAVSADFRHTMRFLKSKGLLTKDIEF